MKYPKIYAVVRTVKFDGEMICTAMDGTNRKLFTHVKARNGGATPRERIVPGLKIKLYSRNGKLNWRRMGR